MYVYVPALHGVHAPIDAVAAKVPASHGLQTFSTASRPLPGAHTVAMKEGDGVELVVGDDVADCAGAEGVAVGVAVGDFEVVGDGVLVGDVVAATNAAETDGVCETVGVALGVPLGVALDVRDGVHVPDGVSVGVTDGVALGVTNEMRRMPWFPASAM